MSKQLPDSIEAFSALLQQQDYVAGRSLATTAWLALRMQRPLFLEGEAGVGKTEIAMVLAAGLGRKLLRLQCYEGLDIHSAVYEWNYTRQMIEIRLAEATGEREGVKENARPDREALTQNVFSEAFLIERPLLQALRPSSGGPPVLLIDELDRADEPFEAFLLEMLSDFQFSIPELGTIRADQPPIVIITSNRTREIHDALKRRCLYYWLDYPDFERELEILGLRLPGLAPEFARQLVAFVQTLRGKDLFKAPGIAETLDWAGAMLALGRVDLDAEAINQTLGVLLKYQDDIASADETNIADWLEESASLASKA